jgi:pimeloyl-ACP methyl ester carboxylesterase/DNA-binding CsgD family transcriptional regulator
MNDLTLTEDGFREALEIQLASSAPEAFSLPGLSEGTLCCGLMSGAGQLVWAEPKLVHWVDLATIDLDQVDLVRRDKTPRLMHGLGLSGDSMLLIGAPVATAQHWPIHFNRAVADRLGDKGVVIVAVSLAHADDDLYDAALSFGMTKLEARVSTALIRLGALPEAASHCRISHETAREAFASARKKVGAKRQADFTTKLSRLVSNAYFAQEDAQRVLVDLFSLTPQQAKLALLLTQGYTRTQAAQIAQVSEARVKEECKYIFEALGVEHAAQIGRIVIEGVAATLLANNGHVELPRSSLKAAPLRFIQRQAGELIAVSDYGPKKAPPIFVLHSGTATRHIPQSLVKRLQRLGYRPLSVDRPGFGLSDFGDPGLDPWCAAADDMKCVMDGLGLSKACFLTRGGNYAMLEFARKWPDHISRVVCLNPDVSSQHSHKREGGIGLVWKAAERYPERFEALSRWIGHQATPGRVMHLLRMLVSKSPADMRAFEAPQEIADFQHAVAMFATGRMAGTLREHRAHTTGVNADPIADASNWTVMMGGQDPMHTAADMERFWTPRLPRATFITIADGGRFLPLSHPNDVMAAIGAG